MNRDETLSPNYLCVSVNVCKETTPEIACTRSTIMGFLHDTPLIQVISLEEILWLVNFRLLHMFKNYHVNAKYMTNTDQYIAFSILAQVSSRDLHIRSRRMLRDNRLSSNVFIKLFKCGLLKDMCMIFFSTTGILTSHLH